MLLNVLLSPLLKATHQTFLKHYSLKFGPQHPLSTYKGKVVEFPSLLYNLTLMTTVVEQTTKETPFYNTNTFYVCAAALVVTVAVGGLLYYYFWSTAVVGASAAASTGSANSPTNNIDSVPDINSIVPDNTASQVIGNPTTDVAQIVVDIPSGVNPLVDHSALPNALGSQLSNQASTPSTSSMCDSVTSSSSSLPDGVAPLSKVSTILSDQSVVAASNLVDTMQTVSAATSATASATVAAVNYGLRYALGSSTSAPTTNIMHTLHNLAAESAALGLNAPGANLFGSTNRIPSTTNVPLNSVLPEMTAQGVQILKNQSSPAVDASVTQVQSQIVNEASSLVAEAQFPNISSTFLAEFYNTSNFFHAANQFKDSLEYSREALLTHPGTMPYFKPICTLSLDDKLLTIFNLGELTTTKFAFVCTLPLALVLASKWFNEDFILYLNKFHNSQLKKYLEIVEKLYYPLLTKAVAISNGKMTPANNVLIRRLAVSVERFFSVVEAFQNTLPKALSSTFTLKVVNLSQKVIDQLKLYRLHFPGT